MPFTGAGVEPEAQSVNVVIVSAPLFTLILLGYLATRLRLLPTSALPGLNTYVLYFAITAMLFQFGSQTPLSNLVNPWTAIVWLAATTIILCLGIFPGLRAGLGWRDASFAGLSTASPNMGFMGIPLIVTLLGPAAVGPLMPIMIVDILAVQSIVIALAHRGSRGSPTLALALRGVLANPMLWAIVLGVAWGAGGINMPGVIAETISLLADSATPVALVTIGAVLAREQQRARTGQQSVTRSSIAWLTAVKLVALPATVWLIGAGAMAAGAPLGGDELTVLTIIAALPTAANTSILAERFGANNAIVASVILASTVLGFITFNTIAAMTLA